MTNTAEKLTLPLFNGNFIFNTPSNSDLLN